MLNSYEDVKFISNNISIVLQGAVNFKNIVDVSNHCAHWRNIFPNAEIILSISVSDCLNIVNIPDRTDYASNIYTKGKTHDKMNNCVNSINGNCDVIIYNPKSSSLPFPPIKNDTTEFNNVNYLIESSKNGIKAANRTFCLRIRNDAIFLDQNFIEKYCNNISIPRSYKYSFFKQRIMVSWIYTLNPFSIERIPFHVSDWFNFGLTEDLLLLWDIPPFPYKDAIYYKVKNNNDSNKYEKKYNVRFAVEQYICINAFKKSNIHFNLNYINDTSYIDLSIDMIIDNFFISSENSLHFLIKKKYQSDVTNPHKRSMCLTGDAWKFIAQNRHIPYKDILTGNVDQNIKQLSNGKFHIDHFPQKYSTHHIHLCLWKKIIFIFFNLILSKKMKSKFLYYPKEFFKDSKFLFVKYIGLLYIS